MAKTKTLALHGRAAAEAALASIEADPKSWKQDAFRCKSGHCFAGYIAFVGGYRWLHPEVYTDARVIRGREKASNVWDAAASILGIRIDPMSPGEAPLYRPENTLADLYDLIDETWPEGAI